MIISLHTPPAAVSSYVTLVESIDGHRLGKAYLPEKQDVRNRAEYKATSVAIHSLESLKDFLEAVAHRSDVAMVLGDSGLREPFRLLSRDQTEKRYGGFEQFQSLRAQYPVDRIRVQDEFGVCITRTKASLTDSSVAYIDVDNIPLEHSNEAVVRGIQAIYPETQPVKCLVRRTTSSNIHWVTNNEPLKGEYGLRIYFQTDTPQQLKAYFSARKDKFEALGCGTLDMNVFGQSNRLDYVGAPVLGESLRQAPRPFFWAGGEGIFTVAPEWLPVEEAAKAVEVTKPLVEVLDKESDRGKVVMATEAALERLLDQVGRAREGDRHGSLVKFGHLLGGVVASGCLPWDEDRIVDWVTERLLAAPNWDDKLNVEVEIENAIRSGLAKGAAEPVWLHTVARLFAARLIDAGVSARDLGVRFIGDEYPRYRPQEGAGVHYFDQGYMTLPDEAHTAIRAALAAGRPVTVYMVGPQGCGKTEAAKALRQGLTDFTLVVPRQALAETGAARFELVNYQTIKEEGGMMKAPLLAICQDSTRNLPCQQKQFWHQKHVMIDEVEQVNERFAPGKLGEAFQATEWMTEKADLLILADADLRQSTVDDVRKLRPGALEISLIHTGQMMEGRVVRVHTSASELTVLAGEKLRAGETVYLCTDSRKEADVVYRALAESAAAGRRLIATRDTYATEEVQALMRNPQLARNYDLIVASPTFSTGISFDFHDALGQSEVVFQNVIGVFKGGSVTAETAKQALRRVRNPGEIHLYATPAVMSIPKVDYRQVRERIRTGQMTPVCGAALTNTPFERGWEMREWTDDTGWTMRYPAPSPEVLHSAFFDALAARSLDLRDISRTGLKYNLLELLVRDGAGVKNVAEDEAAAEEGQAVRRAAKAELRQEWIEDRVNRTYHDPKGGIDEVTVPTITEYHQAKNARKGSGKDAVGVDIFMLQQVFGAEGVTPEALVGGNVKDVGKEVAKQYMFELLHETPEFRRHHDRATTGLVDLGSRKETSKIIPLVQFLAAQVGLNLMGEAADRFCTHNFPLYKKTEIVGTTLAAPADWRWTRDDESVERLLAAVRGNPDMGDILGLTATTHRQMVEQFGNVLKRFGLVWERGKNRDGTHYYTLPSYARRLALATQRRADAAALTLDECEIIQWLNVAARRRVLEASGFMTVDAELKAAVVNADTERKKERARETIAMIEDIARLEGPERAGAEAWFHCRNTDLISEVLIDRVAPCDQYKVVPHSHAVAWIADRLRRCHAILNT